MSGRFVRASKFRHIFGTPAKKEKVYANLRIECTGESNHIAASSTMFAVANPGGGGPIQVTLLAKQGRVDHNAPKVNVHKNKVADIEFSPFANNIIATGAEDGLVKVTVLPEAGVTAAINEANATLEGHQKKLAYVKWSPTANNILASASYDNAVKIWDVETQKCVLSWDEEHSDFIHSIEWNEDGSQLATACKDKFLRIFDPRKKGSAVKGTNFDGNKGSRLAWVSPLGKIINVGFNKASARQFMVHDIKKLDNPIITTDIDSSPGVLLPYFDQDNSILYLSGKGDAAIKYWEVTNDEPFLHFLNEYRDTESIKGCTFLPKRGLDTKICEVAVALRVMKEAVAPVSFTVPRKSDLFQADIYPDTYAGVPVVTAAEWLEGTDKPAAKRSMDPKKAPAQDERKEAVRTAETVEKEITATKTKLATLEAELAAIKSAAAGSAAAPAAGSS